MRKSHTGIEAEIAVIKKSLSELGHMHPGSVSMQKRARGSEYYQLSYSAAGKGHTHYVRSGDVDEVREAVANYRKFRELTNCWIELEIAFAKCRREGASGSSHKK
ncbi:MAG: hypothetical protein KAR40_15840 [Candidatus Sabulitectum sp.]|nr:hypothetical protein [Candidatus Sabulitectum sp.]